MASIVKTLAPTPTLLPAMSSKSYPHPLSIDITYPRGMPLYPQTLSPTGYVCVPKNLRKSSTQSQIAKQQINGSMVVSEQLLYGGSSTRD